MVRTVLLGGALVAASFSLTPAHAEEICVQVQVNAPVSAGTGRMCRYDYTRPTVCGAPTVGWGPNLDVDAYYCIPQVFPPL